MKYLIHDMFETVTYYDNKIVNLKTTASANPTYEIEISYSISKFEKQEHNIADILMPLNDFIEIGIYKKGSFLPVEIKIVRVTKSNNQLKIQLDYIPEKIAIDPNCLLIDIKSADNKEFF